MTEDRARAQEKTLPILYFDKKYNVTTWLRKACQERLAFLKHVKKMLDSSDVKHVKNVKYVKNVLIVWRQCEKRLILIQKFLENQRGMMKLAENGTSPFVGDDYKKTTFESQSKRDEETKNFRKMLDEAIKVGKTIHFTNPNMGTDYASIILDHLIELRDSDGKVAVL